MQHNKTENFYIVLIDNKQRFVSKMLRAIYPLGEKFDLLSSLGFDIQRDSDTETSKIKLYFVVIFKREIFDPWLRNSNHLTIRAHNVRMYFD